MSLLSSYIKNPSFDASNPSELSKGLSYLAQAIAAIAPNIAALLAATPRELSLFVSQSSTDAPTIDALLLNTTTNTATPILTYDSMGEYSMTLPGAFPANKILGLDHADPDSGVFTTATEIYSFSGLAGFVSLVRISNDVIKIYARDSGGSIADGLLLNFPINLYIYP